MKAAKMTGVVKGGGYYPKHSACHRRRYAPHCPPTPAINVPPLAFVEMKPVDRGVGGKNRHR
jgi:hypothetical protein